jgi:hypothetical protein
MAAERAPPRAQPPANFAPGPTCDTHEREPILPGEKSLLLASVIESPTAAKVTGFEVGAGAVLLPGVPSIDCCGLLEGAALDDGGATGTGSAEQPAEKTIAAAAENADKKRWACIVILELGFKYTPVYVDLDWRCIVLSMHFQMILEIGYYSIPDHNSINIQSKPAITAAT